MADTAAISDGIMEHLDDCFQTQTVLSPDLCF